jgi:Dolichyl-phosphate-mannose-protein mannosyltransferase
VWPPFFHTIEALWMLAFTPSRPSILVLMALISVVSALTLFLIAGKTVGPRLALFGAFLYIAFPEVQISSRSVMIDGLIAALELVAVVQLARYIETEEPRYAHRFGLLATAAALSKANGLALLFVPVIAIGLVAKWRLLARKEIWLALLMAVVAAAPWNYFLGRVAMASVGLIRTDLAPPIQRSATLLRELAIAGGVLLPFAVVGVWQKVVRPRRSGRVGAIWASNLALIIAVCVFHAIVPTATVWKRYFLPVLAPILLFALTGMIRVAHSVPPRRWSSGWRTAGVAALTAAAFFGFQFRILKKAPSNFQLTAERLARDPTPRVILASGDNHVEGTVVSEIAMRDSRPRHFVLRASKVLAESDWTGQGYKALFNSPNAVYEYLDSVPVDYVLIDTKPGSSMHQQLLADALRDHPQIWERDASGGNFLQVWRRVHPLSHGEPKITIPMTYTLRHSLSNARE